MGMESKMWPFDDPKASPNLYRQDRASWKRSASFYFQRPVIYFCFGIPIFAPAICLILLAGAEGNLASPLIIGSLLLVTSSISITAGVLLGVRDCRKPRQSKGNQIKRTLEGKSSSTSTPNDLNSRLSLSTKTNISSSPSPNSRCSSNSSLKTGNSTILMSVDKSKLITLKRKTARRKGKRLVRFPKVQLPPVTEEDSAVKSLSRGSTKSNFTSVPENLLAADGNKKIINTTSRRQIGASSNFEELKDYLNVIGLGAVHPERLTKSFDEKELFRQNPPKNHTHEMAIISGSPLGKSLSPRSQYPVVVTDSHERTGIRLP